MKPPQIMFALAACAWFAGAVFQAKADNGKLAVMYVAVGALHVGAAVFF